MLNTGSRFDVSGGSLIITNHISNSSPYDLYLDPEVSTVTDGTIQFGNGGSTYTYTFLSSVPLSNLTLDATSNASAIQQVYSLTLVGNLTIGGTSSVYNTNGLDVSIGGNLTNNNSDASVGLNVGGYRAIVSTQTTYFEGSANQAINGTSTHTNFAWLEVLTAGGYSLTLGHDVTLYGDLTLSTGTFNDGGKNVYLLADADNWAVHTSPNATGGLIFAGTTTQIIIGSGNGVFGNIEINNGGAGLDLMDNSVVNGELKLTNGYFYIDDYSLTLGQSGSITGYNATNYIQLNGVTADQGVTKIFTSNFTSSFTFPIGCSGKYTPATYNFIANTNAAGATLNLVPIDKLHSAVDTSVNHNYLNYYWQVTSTGFTSAPTVTHTYTYVSTDTTGNPQNIQRFYNSNWSTPTGTISYPTFTFSDTYLDGSYTIGDVFGSLPILHSNQSGNWSNSVIWTPNAVPNGHSVVIESGHTVTLSADGANASAVEIIGVLDASNTTSHNIGTVTGTGKIRLAPTASNIYVFPGGSFDAFLASSTSIVEFYGDIAGTMPLNPGNTSKPYQHVEFTGSGIKYISSVDTKIKGNLTIVNGAKLDNTLYNKNLILLGNWYDQNTTTPGFNTGGTVTFEGTTAQRITMNSNTMKETFYNLAVNNSYGLKIDTGSVDVSNQLTLTLGNINFTSTNDTLTITNTSTDAVVGGSVNSFVNGPLRKKISNNSSFQFPVGDTISSGRKRIGYVSVTNTATSGAQIWTAQFFDKNATTDGYDITDLTQPLISVVGNEYWKISCTPGGNANVVLTWDSYTGMHSDAIKRAASAVAEWDTAVTSTWNSAGYSVTDNGQNSGTVATTTPVTFANHVFTIGARAALFTAAISGDWNNPDTWGGTVIPTSNDAVTIAAGTTVTLNTSTEFAKLTIEATGTFESSSNTLTLGGNLELNGTWNGSGGTINMTTGTIFGTGSITGTCSLQVSGSTSIDASADLTLPIVSISAGTTLTNNGNVTINSLTGSNPTASIFENKDTLSFTGANLDAITLTASSCPNTVIYSGTLAQVVKQTTYCNLNFTNSGVKELTGLATINNDIFIDEGSTLWNKIIGTLIFSGVLDNQGVLINDGALNP